MLYKIKEKHRIFVALLISETLKTAIFNWEEEEKNKNPEWFKNIRWLEPKNLHITIIPPWYEDEKGLGEIKKKLRKIDGTGQTFNCAFEKISYGPSQKQPRLIWLSGKSPKELDNFKEKIEKILKIKSEKRPFLLHLTIGRFRPEDFSRFSIKKIDEPFLFEEKIKDFVLMESHLAHSGADYSVIEKFTPTPNGRSILAKPKF